MFLVMKLQLLKLLPTKPHPLKVSQLLLHKFLRVSLLVCGYSFIAIAADAQEATPATPQNKPLERKFTEDSLYSLMVAEIAGNRQMYDVSLEHYAQQAKETLDPQVAARATMIARYLNNLQQALEMALLWVQTAPTNKDALANAAIALMQTGRLQEAFEMAKRLQAEGGEVLFQNIAANAIVLTKPERKRLLQSYKHFLPDYHRDEQLLVGTALLLQQQGNLDDAMAYITQARSLYPRSIPAGMLEANLLHELKRDSEAIAKMGDLLALYPKNTILRNQYAHILTRYDLALAQQQFAILATQLPNDTDTLLSLGIIAMKRSDYKVATNAFERLLDSDQHMSTAHYYLGQIAENQQNWSDAIFNYLQVERGNDFLPATASLLNIFIQQGDLLSAQQHIERICTRYPDQAESFYSLHVQVLIKYKQASEAEKILNKGLQTNALANSVNLLFARAMLYSKRNQNIAAEQDLRHILQLEPGNATALNSLGYLLVDTGQRLREAEELITKAVALKPNDPSIIDSLGWLHFRKGNFPEALRELRRAYAVPSGTSSQDPTVAAHLGEALWVTGNKEDARRIWREGIKQAPDDSTIPLTMKRLKAE